MGHPTIHPTGVTLYQPDKAWPGYVLFQAADYGAILLDPVGREVQVWKGLHGFPNKLLPGGQVFGSTGARNPQFGFQDQLDLVQVDWEGNIVWRFDRWEEIEDPGESRRWLARAHHDFQREGSPTGYFAPGQEPRIEGGKTLVLVHRNVVDPAISDVPLLDDTVIEVAADGTIVWEWNAHEHFEEYGFDDQAKAVLRTNPNLVPVQGGVGDWLHINSLSYVGPNRWYDAGDQRFHPDNVIWDSREANLIVIVDRKTGAVVWKLGPRYDGTDAEKKLGWIIGLHHAHIVPRGLPGEGNLLLFDNGGWAGYGEASPGSRNGTKNALRDYSRVLEIDPTTLAIVWQYTPAEAGFIVPLDASRFYSPFISSAQRLPNGNTLITEGSDGRVFEVTAAHEIVWEFISPYWGSGPLALNMVYRAYKYPYHWVPQLAEPVVHAIAPLDKKTFRVPGASIERLREVVIAGTKDYQGEKDYCVIADPSKPEV